MSTASKTESCAHPNPNSVGLTVADAKKSIAFYCEKLGFTLRECFPNAEAPFWASLVMDNQSIMFGQAMGPESSCEGSGMNPKAMEFWRKSMQQFATAPHGVGVNLYIMVPDIDAYAKKITANGAKITLEPTTQFYGLRDLVLVDPDGYTLTFYTPVAMASCQSCAMPLTDATPGQMYCQYCFDEKSGQLRSYEVIFEGTVSGYFMGMHKMARPEAEKAAREHLAKQPAWKMRAGK